MQTAPGAAVVLPETPLNPNGAAPLSRSWPIWLRAIIFIALLAVAAWAIKYGLDLRRNAFLQTYGVHFYGDISNGYKWATEANRIGVLRYYDDIASKPAYLSSIELDYTPLRLAVIAAWVRWTNVYFPGVVAWRDDFTFTSPMLNFNTACELIASVFVFLLVRMWVIRADDANRPETIPPRPFRGVVQGMIGAMLLWFNPAVIWDAHCWPQWDVWLLPFFLAALLMACVDCWFVAGICLAIGAFMKGQILLGAPLLLLWPLFQRRFDATLRVLGGFALTASIIAFPWMHPGGVGLLWYLLMLISMALIAPMVLQWNLSRRWLLGIGAVSLLLAWPWKSQAALLVRLLPFGLLALLFLSSTLPRRMLPSIYALAVACCAFLLIPLYNAGSAWFTIGFQNGAKKFENMVTGTGTYNIPAMLRSYINWPLSVTAPVHLPLIGRDIPFRVLEATIYAICLLICAFAAATYSRRRDTRFLIAVATPWLCFYILLTQMHGRYLVWAAALSALLAGAGVAMMLLGILVSVIAFCGIVHNQYTNQPAWDRVNLARFQPLSPHLGWILILIACIYLYVCVVYLIPRYKSRNMPKL